MICKFYSKEGNYIVIIAGILSCIFGLIAGNIVPEEAHNLSMLSGMFTGFGGAIAGVGLFDMIRRKLSSPEKLKKAEIKKTDERNIQITKTASVAGYIGGIFLFAILAFVFVGMGESVAAFIAIGAMYVDFIVYLIAYRAVSLKI